MTDSLGSRAKFGVLAPSTNTSVQPEFDAMRPWGVTNHHSRLIIPDTRVTDDASFMAMMDNIRNALFPALEAVLSCDPDYVVLGMSAETFWDGLHGSQRLKRRLEKTAKRGVAMGSDACRAALRACGRSVKRLGVITPYMPIGDRQVRKFFTDCGYEVVNLLGLKCRSPVLIAHESKQKLRDAIERVNRGKVDAIVQVGTNLAMAHVAAFHVPTSNGRSVCRRRFSSSALPTPAPCSEVRVYACRISATSCTCCSPITPASRPPRRKPQNTTPAPISACTSSSGI